MKNENDILKNLHKSQLDKIEENCRRLKRIHRQGIIEYCESIGGDYWYIRAMRILQRLK